MFKKIITFLKERSKKFWIVIVIAIIVLGRLILGSNKPAKVQVVKATKGDLTQSVSTSGTIKADQYSQLTFPSGGLITSVGVTTGEKVSKGQFVAQVDSVILNASYQNALNTYRSTQAAVDLEHDNDKNYGSAETFAQKNTRTAAEVANDDAYNAVLAARENLKNSTLYTPFNGVMDTVSPTSPGINVLPGAANYTIVNPDTVYFDAEVEETDLPNVSLGQKVNIKLDAYPNDNFQGVVSNVGLVAFTSSTGGNAYHIRITLPSNKSLKFRVGMQGDVDIIFNTVPSVLKVSSSSIVNEGDKSFVWEISSGKAKKVEIITGSSSADETEIKSGLTEGQEVIDNPPSNIKAGQSVAQ